MNSINDICEGLLDNPEVIMNDKTESLWEAYIADRWKNSKPNCDALQNPLAPGDTVRLADKNAKIKSINYQMIWESKVSQDRCIKISKESLYSI